MTLAYRIGGKMESLFAYIERETFLALVGDDPRTKVLDLFMGKVKFRSQAPHKRQRPPRPSARPPPSSAVTHGMFLKRSIFSSSPRASWSVIRWKTNGSTSVSTRFLVAEGVYSFCAFNNLYRFGKQLSPPRNETPSTVRDSKRSRRPDRLFDLALAAFGNDGSKASNYSDAAFRETPIALRIDRREQ